MRYRGDPTTYFFDEDERLLAPDSRRLDSDRREVNASNNVGVFLRFLRFSRLCRQSSLCTAGLQV